MSAEYAYALHVEKDFKKAEKIKKTFEKVMKTHPNILWFGKIKTQNIGREKLLVFFFLKNRKKG